MNLEPLESPASATRRVSFAELGSTPLAYRETRWGPMVFLPYDLHVGRSLLLYGEYAPAEANLFIQIIPEGGVAIDVGANVGALTLAMASRASHVIAVEPQEFISRLLHWNAGMSRAGTVEAVWGLAGDTNGIVEFPRVCYTKTGAFCVVGRKDAESGEIETISTPQYTLDSLAPLHQVDFIKVDVEGDEARVLRGATRLIERCRPILFLENDRPPNSAELVGLVYDLGYTPYWHVGMYYSSQNFAGRRENVYPRQAAFNILCVPPERPLAVGGLPVCERDAPEPPFNKPFTIVEY